MSEQELTVSDELFLENLGVCKSIKDAAEASGMTPSKGYAAVHRLKDTIISRARDNLAGYVLKAVNTTGEMLSADSETEKGELRLKAAEGIMDRSGLTKHTNVDVEIESTNGLFIIPAKALVPEEPDESGETQD